MHALLITIFLFLVEIFKVFAAEKSIDCSLPKNVGVNCENHTPRQMFYYSTQLGVCQPFTFFGCEGNTNQFKTSNECKKACSNITSEHRKTQWLHAEKCNGTYLIPDRKYFECNFIKNITDVISNDCPDSHHCAEGNICCPAKEHVCTLQDDSGSFVNGIDDKPRFAWSAAINSCWRFSYFGGKGNYNNFPNFRSCIAFCS